MILIQFNPAHMPIPYLPNIHFIINLQQNKLTQAVILLPLFRRCPLGILADALDIPVVVLNPSTQMQKSGIGSSLPHPFKFVLR
jgi:hypothetical protein